MTVSHDFFIQTPQGVAKLTVPDEEMKICACGCDLFDMAYRVGWFKPANILNAPAQCMRVEVYVCRSCGAQAGPETANKKDAKSNGKGRLIHGG